MNENQNLSNKQFNTFGTQKNKQNLQLLSKHDDQKAKTIPKAQILVK